MTTLKELRELPLKERLTFVGEHFEQYVEMLRNENPNMEIVRSMINSISISEIYAARIARKMQYRNT